MAGGGGNKKRFQYCSGVRQDKKFFISELFKVIQDAIPCILSLQDNVLFPNNFFENIYHIGCANNLHSITNSGLIPGGQILSKRQTVFFTSVDPMNKEHREPNNINLDTTSCMVQAEKVEVTSKLCVLGRHKTCSIERI